MPINHNEITVPLHGGLLHSTYILIAKYICWKRGYKLKGTDGFAEMYKCPGVPDIYLEYEYKTTDAKGRKQTIRQSVCVEIETHMTKAAAERKYEQFCRPGMREPVIIDMGDEFEEYKERKKAKGIDLSNDILWAESYIEERLVL